MKRSILLLLVAMAVPSVDGFRGSTNRKSEKVGGQQLGDRASSSSSSSNSSGRSTGNRRILEDSEASSTSTSSSLHVSTTASAAHQHSHHQPHRSKHNSQQQNNNNNTPNHKFKNFEEVLATYHEEPMMVIFTAVNCGPCKLMKHELNRVKGILGEEKFKVFAVDTEKFPHIGSRFDIHALPCLLLVQNGEPLLRIEGVLKAEKIMEQIQTTRLLQ